jgi:hypothetical protein
LNASKGFVGLRSTIVLLDKSILRILFFLILTSLSGLAIAIITINIITNSRIEETIPIIVDSIFLKNDFICLIFILQKYNF